MNYTFDGSRVFFTSDTHFNHTNIIRFCERPFERVDEMNEKLIDNWNSVVSPEDFVFHLGDFCLGGAAEQNIYLYPTQYDVGVDNNNYRPVSFEQVKEIIQTQIRNAKI